MLEVRKYHPDDERFRAIVDRGADFDAEIGVQVAEIVAAVKKTGGEALLEFVRRFDAPLSGLDDLKVTRAEIDAAWNGAAPEFLDAIRLAADNIRRFHEYQVRSGYEHDDGDGVRLAKRVLPLSRVGIYCPAGTAPLFSSLLMNAVPARIAGVGEIAVAIPPRRDGKICPAMLATARLLGLEEIYRMGGAQAVAALAFGAGPVRRVDKIVGPGNAYVATAKRQVFGTVGIDSVAGPSEIVVIADDTADPGFIAADLLSQVEHGSGSDGGVVLPESRVVAEKVAAATAERLGRLERAETARRALSRYGAVFLCRTLDEAVDASNRIAPEHLEIVTAEPRRLLERVVNAGAVFLGAWSPEPVGDYFAGTNHVLPTTGAARFSSSLGVADFLKDISIIEYSRERLAKTGGRVVLMAEMEGLQAHAEAVRVRMRRMEHE